MIRPAAAAVSVAAALVLSGCSHSTHIDGVPYPQRIDEPRVTLPSTQGDSLDLRSRCSGRVCVVAFIALGDRRATSFLHKLTNAASTIHPTPIVLALTIDPGHDTLPALRRALRGTGIIGARTSYAVTEQTARFLAIDVEPPSSDPVPIGEPQAVVFRPDGQAAIGWDLSMSEHGLHNDLSIVAGG